MMLDLTGPAMPSGDRVEPWTAWTARETRHQAWVKDVRSRFLAVSVPLARSCGAHPDAMAGNNEATFFSGDLVRQFRCDDLRVVALDQPAIVEERGPGGRFATLKRPLRDGNGRVVATLGIAWQWPGDRPLPALPADGARARAAPPPWLRSVRARMERDFRAPLRVRNVAAEFGVHPNHVSRAFRRYYGVTTLEWLHRLRVAWVAEMLISAELALSTIAQRAGFADQAHMTRVFKRYYGLTPGEYRRELALA